MLAFLYCFLMSAGVAQSAFDAQRPAGDDPHTVRVARSQFGSNLSLGKSAEGLFTRATLATALLQGFSILAVCLAVLLLARRGHPPDAARALTFATLVVALLVVILVNRSWTLSALLMLRAPNPALRWVLLGASLFLAVSLAVPFAQHLFRFAPLHLPDVLMSIGAGFVCVLWFEVVKRVRRPSAASRST